jgi:hypothetical protein
MPNSRKVALKVLRPSSILKHQHRFRCVGGWKAEAELRAEKHVAPFNILCALAQQIQRCSQRQGAPHEGTGGALELMSAAVLTRTISPRRTAV